MKDVYKDLTLAERKWLDRSIKVMRITRLAYKTEQNYSNWIRRYLIFLGRVNPEWTSETKVEEFLTHLVMKLELARATQDQAYHAVCFFYEAVLKKPLDRGKINAVRSKRPARKRTSVAQEVVKAFLEDLPNRSGYPCRLIGYLLYGMGLRLDETLKIRIKDVDFHQSRIVLKNTKGDKDRVRPIPCNLVEPIREQVIRAKGVYAQARLMEIPVQMPGGMARRYRNAATAFSWFWLFPLRNPSPEPRNRERRVWWHCLPQTVQEAFKTSAKKHGLETVVTPHVMRHCWASHEYERTRNLTAIQKALGHKDVSTTQVYVHEDMEAGCQGETWTVAG